MAGGNKGGALASKHKGDIISYGVKDLEHIFRGTPVSLTGGYAENAPVDTDALVGIAEEEADNNDVGHVDGAKSIRVRTKGIFKFMTATPGDAIDQIEAADVGGVAAIAVEHSITLDGYVKLATIAEGSIGIITKVDIASVYVDGTLVNDTEGECWVDIRIPVPRVEGVDASFAATVTGITVIGGIVTAVTGT